MLALVLIAALQDPVPGAIHRLSSDDIAAREQAERDLALLGDPAARALEALLDSGDSDLAGRAKRALMMNRRCTRLPRSLSLRVPAVLDRDWTLRELLALDLTEAEEAFFAPRAANDWSLPPGTWFRIVHGRASAAAIADAAKRAPDETLRAWALAALQQADPKGAARLAMEGLRAASPSLRVQCAFTLGDVGPRSAAGDLRKLLEDPVEAVSQAARLAIFKLVPGADLGGEPPMPARLSRLDQLTLYARATESSTEPGIAWVDVVDAARGLAPRLKRRPK